MPDEDNKILKENYGEKSLKATFMISAELECLPKKYSHVKIILKNLIQQKKLSMHLLVTHCFIVYKLFI